MAVRQMQLLSKILLAILGLMLAAFLFLNLFSVVNERQLCSSFRSVANNPQQATLLAAALEKALNLRWQSDFAQRMGASHHIEGLETLLAVPWESFGLDATSGLKLILVRDPQYDRKSPVIAVGIGYSRIGVFFRANPNPDVGIKLENTPILSCDLSTPASREFWTMDR